MYTMDQTIQHSRKHSFKWNIINMERELGPAEWEKKAHRTLLMNGGVRHGAKFAEG